MAVKAEGAPLLSGQWWDTGFKVNPSGNRDKTAIVAVRIRREYEGSRS